MITCDFSRPVIATAKLLFIKMLFMSLTTLNISEKFVSLKKNEYLIVEDLDLRH